MMTIKAIQEKIAAGGKSLNRSGLYLHLNKLGIEPIGCRQRPQLYPADTAERVLAHFGLNGTRHHSGRILSLKEIHRRAGRKGGKR